MTEIITASVNLRQFRTYDFCRSVYIFQLHHNFYSQTDSVALLKVFQSVSE
jgi:hypothetical protein